VSGLKRVRVRVPATTANLGPGFDVLGMALGLYNSVEMEEMDEGLLVEVEGEGAAEISRLQDNLAVQAAERVFESAGWRPTGLRVVLRNKIPVTRGLGSSSAALVGGLVAANALAGDVLTREELLRVATEMEGHPDNVAPALLGGMVVSGMVRGKLHSVRLQPPEGLRAVVAVPEFELATSLARSVLPERVSREDAIFTSSHVGLLVAAVMNGDVELFGQALEDRFHQPYRERLIPGMRDVMEAAEQAGALGVCLSGAGPTMIAFTMGQMDAVGEAMAEAFDMHGVECRVMELDVEENGVLVERLKDPLFDKGGLGV
jgi:homoserine kinase